MLDNIYKYSAFTKNALQESYTYRFKALMWSISSVFNMLVQFYLWKSIYEEVNGDFMGVDKYSYLAYITFGVIFHSLTYCMENMAIAEDIKSGNIAMNLTKPFNYKFMVLFRHIGSKIGAIIGLIPIFGVALVLTKNFSISIITFLLFLVSMLLAFIILFLFAYAVGLLSFWTTNYWGIQLLTNALMGLFSGQLMAVHFYTELGNGAELLNTTLSFLHTPAFMMFFKVLSALAYCLPFQSMYYTPMSILSGIIDKPSDILFHIILQVFWIFVMNMVGHILWNKGQKKITILGG